jgi:hypothetical protein
MRALLNTERRNKFSRRVEKPWVAKPASCVNAGVAQLVERNLAKVEVESSRLFSRSRIRNGKPRLPVFVRAGRF